MEAKFRSLNAKDIKEIGAYVKSASVKKDAYYSMASSLDSKDLFGSYAQPDAIITSDERAHKRALIQLSVPTFNFVTGRSGCKLLAKMLGFQDKEWKMITDIELLYDMDAQEFVEIKNAVEDGRYLYGAQIAAYFIEKLDIDKAIVECIQHALNQLVPSSQSWDSAFTILTDAQADKENVYKAVANYYVEYNGEKLRRGVTTDNLDKKLDEALFPNNDTRLTYLLNMNPDKSALYGMLNYNIVVTPSELRPEAMGKHHKLTSRYVSVINANNEIQIMFQEHYTPNDMQAKYQSLELAVRRLQYKCRDIQGRTTDDDDLSMIERIKGKFGQVREYNLGKRQDYSARAVVTVNPYLPLDQLNIPETIVPRLYEYHALPYLARNLRNNNETKKDHGSDHAYSVYDKLDLLHLDNPRAKEEVMRIVKEQKLMEKVPIYMGRQPTLHKQSLQGFHAGISKSQAIEVSPLVCSAYNMDFDGDQAHLELPLGPKAIKEVNDLIMTTKNIFLAKTGECTIAPRQEMLYGLYVATKSDYQVGEPVYSYESLTAVRTAVIQHKVKCWDTVATPEYPAVLAGEAALIASFPAGALVPRNVNPKVNQMQVIQVTSKTIGKYMDKLLEADSEGNLLIAMGTGNATVNTFVGAINHVVELGFRLARLYTPSMSLLADAPEIPEYDDAISVLHKNMEDIDFLYSIGMETADNYRIVFDDQISQLSKKIDDNIFKKLGEQNGYSLLAQSGARGNKSNLGQIFAYKGRVKKNESESFDALIENSYITQLSPFESFIAAYGGRQGQIDKSLNTGNTGYASRLMWHATQGVAVKMEDCGTTEGIQISKNFLATMCDEEDQNKRAQEVQDIFKHTITGRYDMSGRLIDEYRAGQLASDDNVTEITIRSPLKCKCAVCQKCYGVDWSTRKPAIVGLPAGLIDAQSIGEPGTQLTMKSFQKGGVAGKADLTSAFAKVEAYIKCLNIASKSADGSYSGYDPIAWATGTISESRTKDVTKKCIKIIPDDEADKAICRKKILVPVDLEVKHEVTKGEGLSFVHGDYYTKEILDYCGIEEAQRYLIYKLYNLYKSECNIRIIHFEVLVSCMTRYMIIDTDRSDLRVGQYATYQELFAKDTKNTRYRATLISVDALNNASTNAIDTIALEDPVDGLSRSCLLGLTDDLTRPISRMILGQTIINGTHTNGFLEERKKGF